MKKLLKNYKRFIELRFDWIFLINLSAIKRDTMPAIITIVTEETFIELMASFKFIQIFLKIGYIIGSYSLQTIAPSVKIKI